MARWHAKSCHAPAVVVEDGCPRCRACHCSPDLDALIEAQKSTSAFTPLPADEPLGQLNLFWPNSIPYVSTSPLGSVQGGANEQRDPDQNEDAPAPTSIYPLRLAQNEFRLSYLSGPEHDSLVHAELNVYDMERYPEYETTSYTWGGEDGDSTLYKPLFLGPYWDILLQTQNCWSMLRSMRPYKGLRIIWVDAICINQNDTKERDEQVSKMAQIYTRCRRVYVYLEPDLTPPTATHPLRRPLEKPEVDLAKLLQRRYFSRLWVTQELILSPEAAFRLGDTEFWMNSLTMSTLSASASYGSLDHTAAPWFRHLGKGYFPGDLCQTLRAVSRSQCQDPRDRIFGICALIRDGLQPNYRLSYQHVFIGVFGYILLVLEYADVLLYAAGRDAWGRYPSWVPDWTVSSLDRVFQGGIATHQEGALLRCCAALVSEKTRMFFMLTENRPRTINGKTSKIKLFGSHPTPYTGFYTSPSMDEHRCYDMHPYQREAKEERLWHRAATIDASTGTLSINLVYLLTFQSRPTKVPNGHGLNLFAVEAESTILFLSANTPLSAIIEPGQDRIFVLEGDEEALFYLILRPIKNSDIYRVVAHGHEIAFRVPVASLRPAQEEELHLHLHQTQGGSPNVLPILTSHQMRALSLADLQHNLLRSLCRFYTRFTEETIDHRIFNYLLLDYVPRVVRQSLGHFSYQMESDERARKAKWEPAALKAVQGVLNETRGSTPGFLISFIRCLHKSLEPRVQGDFVCITLKDDEPTFRDCMRNAIWESIDNTTASRNSRVRQAVPVRRLRASKDTLIDWIEQTVTFARMSELTPAIQKTHESEFEMAQRRRDGPKPLRPEDERIRWSRWPKVIMDEFKIDGRTMRVNIA